MNKPSTLNLIFLAIILLFGIVADAMHAHETVNRLTLFALTIGIGVQFLSVVCDRKKIERGKIGYKKYS